MANIGDILGFCTVMVGGITSYYMGYYKGRVDGKIQTVNNGTSGTDIFKAEQCFLSSYQVRKALIASYGFEAVGSESVEEMYKRCFGAMYKPPVNPYTKN